LHELLRYLLDRYLADDYRQRFAFLDYFERVPPRSSTTSRGGFVRSLVRAGRRGELQVPAVEAERRGL
jgi:hypothetical protein